MKRMLLLTSLIFTFFLITIPVQAHSDLIGEHIESFDDEITINKDGTIDVSETIVYNFDTLFRHGIFREIPYIKRNTEGKRYKMDFKNISVEDEAGNKYQYTTEYEDDNIKLKIGDPNNTITGEHLYKIHYQVSGALTYFSDHDELYWNVNGNAWNVPIGFSKAIIHFPPAISAENIGVACYTGLEGSADQQCTSRVNGSDATFETTEELSSNQGMTVAVRFPPDIVAHLEPKEVIPFFNTTLGKVTFVAIVIALVIWYILLPIWLPIKWFLSGRDPKISSSGPMRAWFDPPKTKSGRPLTPAETGTLIDEHAGNQEISALIVNLAQRGYFKIVEKGKNDFEFVKMKDYSEESNLLSFEQTLLKDLFDKKETVRLKDVELYDTVKDIQDDLYKGLVNEGFFPENPGKVRSRYAILAGLAAVTFNFFLAISAGVFGRLMPHKTTEGVHATNVARSLKNFLTSQERQLSFQAEKQMMFEKLLPFAVAFGVEKIWAERFKDIDLKQPDWYQGTYTSGTFNSHTFTRSLNSSFSSFRSAATPTRSSSGYSSGFSGGSSGGGGGGGGGGSW